LSRCLAVGLWLLALLTCAPNGVLKGRIVDVKLVDLVLGNVSDGYLETRFQELVGETQGINENALSYVGNAQGDRVTKITLEIEVMHRPAFGGNPAATTILSGGEITKRPKRAKAAQAAHVGPDGNLVVFENPHEQIDAFNGEGSGGVVHPFAAAANGENANDGK